MNTLDGFIAEYEIVSNAEISSKLSHHQAEVALDYLSGCIEREFIKLAAIKLKGAKHVTNK